jgi:hypothetical protein
MTPVTRRSVVLRRSMAARGPFHGLHRNGPWFGVVPGGGRRKERGRTIHARHNRPANLAGAPHITVVTAAAR